MAVQDASRDGGCSAFDVLALESHNTTSTVFYWSQRLALTSVVWLYCILYKTPKNSVTIFILADTKRKRDHTEKNFGPDQKFCARYFLLNKNMGVIGECNWAVRSGRRMNRHAKHLPARYLNTRFQATSCETAIPFRNEKYMELEWGKNKSNRRTGTSQ